MHNGVHLCDFHRKEAIAFLDWGLTERKICATTYNNWVRESSVFFEVLKERDEVTVNPFVGIKRKPESPKKRRTFTVEEQKTVARAAMEREYWLFIAILLTFYCGLRKTEINRLHFEYFDLKEGLINMPAQHTKNRKPRTITIPVTIMQYFLDVRFSANPTNYIVFGYWLRPHATIHCGHNTIKGKHFKLLRDLEKEGKISNLEGLGLYSWKHTFTSWAIDFLPPVALMEQLGHSSLDITMRYYHKKKINTAVQKMENVFA